eukprot:CAMPEP_0182885982 /NCGR_PEP_ID=MMETSP0034_2-20130328/19940_1 /TAXON_ID=156128 /ORGANISM="Nephroselmis pyriformis, Strain CCMP717" /LENGTH=139 /DNA_ID=CAMNT_0025019271 /DNA_START=77 /DNA_END=492 /DNA_ORIENTATION=-
MSFGPRPPAREKQQLDARMKSKSRPNLLTIPRAGRRPSEADGIKRTSSDTGFERTSSLLPSPKGWVPSKASPKPKATDPGDGRGDTFIVAATSGSLKWVNRLLESGTGLELNHRSGETPLYAAAVNGHASVVRRLVEAG